MTGLSKSAAPVGVPADRPARAALCPDRDGHKRRRHLGRPPPEGFLQRLQPSSEPGKHDERGTQRELHGWWVEWCWRVEMCIPNDFERSGSFRTPSQEKPNLLTSIAQSMTLPPSCPEGSAPVPLERLALFMAALARVATEPHLNPRKRAHPPWQDETWLAERAQSRRSKSPKTAFSPSLRSAPGAS